MTSNAERIEQLITEVGLYNWGDELEDYELPYRILKALKELQESVDDLEGFAAQETAYGKFLEAKVDDQRRKIDVLIQVGDFRIDHIFNGACPDMGSHDDRDPDCLACAALTTPTNPEGENQ